MGFWHAEHTVVEWPCLNSMVYSWPQGLTHPHYLYPHLLFDRTQFGSVQWSRWIGLPCIWTRNSVFTRRDDSDSLSFRWPHKASISSMKTMHGCRSRATSNKHFTPFSLSPSHFERRSDELTAINVLLHSVAIALAKYDLPVPGG